VPACRFNDYATQLVGEDFFAAKHLQKKLCKPAFAGQLKTYSNTH
jgi:hypothetical protein